MALFGNKKDRGQSSDTGPGSSGSSQSADWRQIGGVNKDGVKTFERQTPAGNEYLTEGQGSTILYGPNGQTTSVSNTAGHDESGNAHVASIPQDPPASANASHVGAVPPADPPAGVVLPTALPTSASPQAGEAVAATPSPFGSPENDRGLTAGQNAMSPPDVQDARVEVHQPAYTGGAPVEKVDYLKNGATLTTTSTGAEIETTAAGNSYTVKSGAQPSSAPELVSEHGGVAEAKADTPNVYGSPGFSSPEVDTSGMNNPTPEHSQAVSSAVDAKMDANANPDLTAGNVGAIASGDASAAAGTVMNPPDVATAQMKSEDTMASPAPAPSPMNPPDVATAQMKSEDMMATAPPAPAAPANNVTSYDVGGQQVSAGVSMPVPITAEPTPPPVSGLTEYNQTGPTTESVPGTNTHTPGLQL